MMKTLKRDMEELVDSCKREIPRAFESDEYTHLTEDAINDIQAQSQAVTQELDKSARAMGFGLRTTSSGITPVALKDGQPLSQEEYGTLPEAEKDRLRGQAEEIQHSITEI